MSQRFLRISIAFWKCLFPCLFSQQIFPRPPQMTQAQVQSSTKISLGGVSQSPKTQNLYPEPTWIWKAPSCSRFNNLRGFRTNRYDKPINKQPRATIAQETFKLCYTRQYPVSVLYHCSLIKMLLLHDSFLTFINSICLKAFSSVWVVKKKVVDENKWTSVAIAYHRQNTTCSNCCCYSTLNNMNAHMANLSMLHWLFILCLFWH